MTPELNVNLHPASLVDATILVSVDECGRIDCIEYSNYNVQTKLKAEKFREQKIASGNLHTFYYLKVKLPLPVCHGESENYQ